MSERPIIREKGPCVQSLEPHIKALMDAGFEVQRKKRKDSGDKRVRKKHPRIRRQKERPMSEATPGNGQTQQSQVQPATRPAPHIQVGAAYGKVALKATGRFLYFAAAAAAGTAITMKVSSWLANRDSSVEE